MGVEGGELKKKHKGSSSRVASTGERGSWEFLCKGCRDQFCKLQGALEVDMVMVAQGQCA